MLIGFSFENFASFKQETSFSMLASKKDEFIDLNTFEILDERLLKSSLIYGPNGSGKTNWIKALSFMKDVVIKSVIDKTVLTKYETFKFVENAEGNKTAFHISFIKNEVLYNYGFSILDNSIVEEWLEKKVKRTTVLFSRKKSNWKSISLHGTFKKAEKIKHFTRDNSLFLTTSAMFNVEIANEIVEWFNDLIIIIGDFKTPGYTIKYMVEKKDNKDRILKELKIADSGILDFELEVFEKGKESTDKIKTNQFNRIDEEELENKTKELLVDLKTRHNVYDINKEVVKEIELSFQKYQSLGTIKFFELLGPILDSLENGKVLIIDEIDSRLHCRIVQYILSLYNSIDKNSKNSQLICNTHNVLLLGEDLRRDQIWFVQKNSQGESELYSLDDFKNVRKEDPKLRKYLLGAYGAIPDTTRGWDNV